MKVLIGFLLLVFAFGLIAYDHYDIAYWRTPPYVRVNQKWKQEIDHIVSKSNKLKTDLQLLKTIEMTTTDQQFNDLIDRSRPPFTKSPRGVFTLKIQIMPWIEDMKYGYLVQHELFDKMNNKVNEFNINIDIGYLW